MSKGILKKIVQKSMSKLFLLLCLLAPMQAKAFVATIENIPVSSEAYAKSVLNMVLSAYNPPLGTQGSAKVLVKIAKDGRPYSCELKNQVTGYEVYNSICNAVLNVQPFGPIDQNFIEITMTFEHAEPFTGIEDRILPPIASVDEIFSNAESRNQNNSQENIPQVQENQSVEQDNTLVVQEILPEQQEESSDNTVNQHTNLATDGEMNTNTEVISNNTNNLASTDLPTIAVGTTANTPSNDIPLTTIQSGQEQNTQAPVYSERLENESIPTAIENQEIESVSNVNTNQENIAIERSTSINNGNMQSYKELVHSKIESHILIPLELKSGRYEVEVGMMVDGAGDLLYYSILESSGSEFADDAVIRALSGDKVIPPTPNGQEEELILHFTIVK